MRATLFFQAIKPGKLPAPAILKAQIAGGTQRSRLFFVRDPASGYKFLIDTGAELSVLPKSLICTSRSKPADLVLYAANGSAISTFGRKRVTVSFGLRRNFSWDFLVADVSMPIIGADFLSHFSLLVNVGARKLADRLTGLNISGVFSVGSYMRLFAISPAISADFKTLLEQFPSLTTPQPCTAPVPHSIRHYISTKGSPVFARVRKIG